MSGKVIQQAVLAELSNSGRPMSVKELATKIRTRAEFRNVTDFAFRSAVLAMTAVGSLQSTATNEIAVRTD